MPKLLSSRHLFLMSGLLASLVLVSCGGSSATTVTERLWVSGIPTKPNAELKAFATMRSGDDDKYLGALFEGTLLRGSHDVFHWHPDGKERATLEFLQDGKRFKIRLESCKPKTGFDMCVLIKGRVGNGEYYSRKRWVVRRPGRKRDALGGVVLPVIAELAVEDPELATALDALNP